MQGATSVALTMLDVLSYRTEIPVCTAYEIDGEETRAFPYGARLARAKPVLKTLKGWHKDISGLRRREDLPTEALAYIAFVEEALGCPITHVSVGPQREAYIVMR